MSEIAVVECETAADVMRLAREARARRKASYAKPEPRIPMPLAPRPILEVAAVSFPLPLKEIVARLTESYVEKVIEGDISTEPTRPSFRRIIFETALHFDLSVVDILSQRRTLDVVYPRQVAMYLAKILTLRSFPEIGRRFGGRDHTTVLHAVRKIQSLMRTDEELVADINAILAKLEATYA